MGSLGRSARRTRPGASRGRTAAGVMIRPVARSHQKRQSDHGASQRCRQHQQLEDQLQPDTRRRAVHRCNRVGDLAVRASDAARPAVRPTAHGAGNGWGEDLGAARRGAGPHRRPRGRLAAVRRAPAPLAAFRHGRGRAARVGSAAAQAGGPGRASPRRGFRAPPDPVLGRVGPRPRHAERHPARSAQPGRRPPCC